MSEQNPQSPIIEKYQALETRHRFMVFGLVAALILVIFDFSWYQPEEAQQKNIRRELANIQKQRTDLSDAIQQRQRELMGTAFNEKRQQIETLKQQEKIVDEQLAQYAQLVSPRQMPGLLKNIFEKSQSLELMALKKHPVKPAFKKVASSGENKKETGEVQKNVSFYRHDFTVTLRGRYFELLNSLKTMESMDLKIYWDSLDYKVDEYPNAEINLTIYTYSYDKDWIGA